MKRIVNSEVVLGLVKDDIKSLGLAVREAYPRWKLMLSEWRGQDKKRFSEGIYTISLRPKKNIVAIEWVKTTTFPTKVKGVFGRRFVRISRGKSLMYSRAKFGTAGDEYWELIQSIEREAAVFRAQYMEIDALMRALAIAEKRYAEMKRDGFDWGNDDQAR